MNPIEFGSVAGPHLQRIRHQSVTRNLTVVEKHLVTPRMIRLTLGGDELAGFTSPSPDDHIKFIVPGPEGEEQKRDFTPRRFDPRQRLLSIDFAMHEGGCASAWAQNARVGDHVQIRGPRGSAIVSAPGAWWLLAGDETALPSIARRLEEMAAGTRVWALMAVTGTEEEQLFDTRASLTPIWLHRPATHAADPAPILNAIAELDLPPALGFVWIAAEEQVARAVRSYFIQQRGHPPDWIKASAYWSLHPAGE